MNDLIRAQLCTTSCSSVRYAPSHLYPTSSQTKTYSISASVYTAGVLINSYPNIASATAISCPLACQPALRPIRGQR